MIKCVVQGPPPENEESMNTIPIISDEEAAEAIVFSGVTEVGGVSHDVSSLNAAGYYAGYMANKLFKFHLKQFQTPLASCDKCCNILGPLNYDFHMHTSFKEYHDDGTPG